MSNARHRQRLNPGSGQMARPRWTWKGIRLPRSARKRWELLEAIRKTRELVDGPVVKGLREALPRDEEITPEEIAAYAEKHLGVQVMPWQLDLLRHLPKKETPVG